MLQELEWVDLSLVLGDLGIKYYINKKGEIKNEKDYILKRNSRKVGKCMKSQVPVVSLRNNYTGGSRNYSLAPMVYAAFNNIKYSDCIYRIGYRDGNKQNINISNLVLKDPWNPDIIDTGLQLEGKELERAKDICEKLSQGMTTNEVFRSLGYDKVSDNKSLYNTISAVSTGVRYKRIMEYYNELETRKFLKTYVEV